MAQHIGKSLSYTTMIEKKKTFIFLFFLIMFAKILQQYICNCSKLNEYSTFGGKCVFFSNTCMTWCYNAKNANAIDILYMNQKRLFFKIWQNYTIKERFQMINEFEITYCRQTSEIALVYRNVIVSIICYIILPKQQNSSRTFLGMIRINKVTFA